ncbi:chemotaxis protein CheD [uncultured Acetobacteroides sp.]|uniref:chemotaxis protein CheD n=1 Tax=uncultured Acetobacteroides sp. TaxID=1760811 RepID=UPI0029F4F0D2|nr:chemotaxis protein CheD [uncultured Acetobacteroides sp.]
MMDNIEQHFLYPSALFASAKPHRVVTVLGSCVSVCLWDPILLIGGINHYMLPFWNGNGLASPKYGNIAIEKLIERMLLLGSSKANLRAKVFGGGEVIETNIANFRIGERNIAIAKELLEAHRIPIVAQSVGGKNGRKLMYVTATGEVFQKIIEKKL